MSEDGPDRAIALAIALVVGLVAALVVGGALSSLAFGGGWVWPHLDAVLSLGLGVLDHVSDPAKGWPSSMRAQVAGPLAYWSGVAAVLAAVVGLAGAARRRFGPRTSDGFASASELRREASIAAARRKAALTRPTLSRRQRHRRAEIGYPLGRAKTGGVALWPSWEASVRVVAEPGAGKTRRVLVPILAQHPGPALATSSKSDLYALTVGARRAGGRPVAVFDPDGVAPSSQRLTWSPVAGCEDSRTAERRAGGLLQASRADEEVRNPGLFTDSAQALLRCFLAAAALDGRDMTSVLAWAASLGDPTPADILRRRRPDSGWAETVLTHTTGAPETTSGVGRYLARALACFAHADLLETCCPAPGAGLDIAAHLQAAGTIYLLGGEEDLGGVAPLVTALATEVLHEASRLARRAPGQRLDPPLLVLLDEVANIAPLPNLASLVATGRGRGIVTVYALQSFSQAVERWGASQAQTLANATTITVVYGGLGSGHDLEELERLCGRRRVRKESVHVGGSGQSATRSWETEAVMRADEIRTLRRGEALVLWGSLPPVVSRFADWRGRPEPRHPEPAGQTLSVAPAYPPASWVSGGRVR